MQAYRNLPELLVTALRNGSDRPFLIWREGKTVVTLSRTEALSRIAGFAAGLREQGVRPGDRIGILAPSSPEWLLFDWAVLCAGAVTVPMFSNLSAENLEFEIRDSGIATLLVQDGAQASLVRRFLPPGCRLLSIDPVEGAPLWTSLHRELPDPGAWIDERVREIEPGHPATIIYTSGSTGRPKGVVLGHAGFCFQVQAVRKRFPTDAATDLGLSALPLAHVFERLVSIFHIANGYPLAVSRDVQKVGEDLAVFRPSIFTVVPRLLEKMLAKVEESVGKAGPLRKWVGKAALLEAGAGSHILSAPASFVFDRVAWSKVREGMGGRLRLVVSGGAPLDPRMERTLSRMGIPVYQGYGMTEQSPVIAVNFPGANRTGTVGLPLSGVEVKINHDDEVMVRSPSALLGLWNDPEASAKLFDAEGWFATGDLGRIDAQGFLVLTGRKKDLCKTAGGKYVAPAPIEDALITHPWIEHAVVAADDRKFVAAIFSLDSAAIRAHLGDSGSIRAVSDHVASPAFHAEMQRHLNAVNHGLDDWMRVRRWIVAPSPFRIETGELTPTLKVRRSFVLDKYSHLLESIYSKKG